MLGEFRQSRKFECSQCTWSGWISLKDLGITQGVRTPRPDDDKFDLKAVDLELPEELLAEEPVAPAPGPESALASATSDQGPGESPPQADSSDPLHLELAEALANSETQAAPKEPGEKAADGSNHHHGHHKSHGSTDSHRSHRSKSGARRTGLGRAIDFLTSSKGQPGKERPRDIILAAAVTLVLMVLILMGQRACGSSAPAEPQGRAAPHNTTSRSV